MYTQYFLKFTSQEEAEQKLPIESLPDDKY